MLKQRFITVVAIAASLLMGTQTGVFANTLKKKQVTFKVRVENISNKDGLVAVDGTMYPLGISPGFYVVANDDVNLFKAGKKASAAIESQAEDGNPSVLASRLLTMPVAGSMGVFNTPVGADKAGPIFSGGAFEFSFTAAKGMKLNLTQMFGQSNDLFYAPAAAIELFDAKGNPVTGDITGAFQLWDAGTEVNQAPGIGPDQGPRQKAVNTGAAENGVVRLVNDGFVYPNTKEVLRITITVE